MADQAHDPQCVFCKIIRGEIPSARVLETPDAVAFLDVNPLNPGHTLLVSREHHPRLTELPDDLAARTASLLPRLCRAVQAATNAEGLNVVVNIGRVASQSVDHVHWHIIPRFTGDPVHWPWPQGRYQGDEMDRVRAAIEQALGGSPAS